jgi:hypothetical protein
MRISGPTPPLPPVTSHARPTGHPEAYAPAETPAEGGKPHGVVRAAEHSHHSDVAALRRWINAPDLRDDLTLPNLLTAHKGQGFQKAVAAYQAVIAIAPPATDPMPVVTDPPPVVADPAPAVPDADPVVKDPTPVVPDPDPLLDVLLPESTGGEEALTGVG